MGDRCKPVRGDGALGLSKAASRCVFRWLDPLETRINVGRAVATLMGGAMPIKSDGGRDRTEQPKYSLPALSG